MKRSVECALCGLQVKSADANADNQFCCNGCRMVYSILLESGQGDNPTGFKETDLYKQCVAAGVVPDPEGTTPLTGLTVEADDNPGVRNKLLVHDDAHAGSNSLLTLNMTISQMWCPACAWVIEKALLKSKGVIKASCNFSSDRGKVIFDPVKTSPEKIFCTIEKLGYHAASFKQKPQKKRKEFIRLVVTFFLTMNVMMLSWAIYSGFFIDLSPQSVQMISWPVFLMASLVVFYGGHPIHKRALTAFQTGRPGMETLISTGSFSAYCYSLFHLYNGSLHLYFDAASMLILLTLTGKRMEQNAKSKIAEGLWDFFSLVPQKVKICNDRFPKGRYVSIKQLSEGDIFLAVPGEILAADGRVTKGRAVIDESSITGEAKPVFVKRGDAVKSGTQVVSGAINASALKIGDASVIGRMMAIMENSLSEKTTQTRRFETFLKLFVPLVMGLSICVYFFWTLNGLSNYEAFSRGISVLVISCPCALGIAIPLALVAGVSQAGKKGILVRDFEAFEKIKQVDTVVFDKTGTLTTGNLSVLGMDTVYGFPEKKAWQIIFAMEKGVDHYIAHTIRKYGTAREIKPIDPENKVYRSNGVVCNFQGNEYRFGSLNLIKKDLRPVSRIVSHPVVKKKDAQVISTVYLSENDTIIATVHLGDTIKKGVKSLISDLDKKGFDNYLVSGDASGPALNVGSLVNIPIKNIHGGLLPHEKAGFIKELKQAGKKTVMVGDGVNDAAAMAQSDIAVAVHSGLTPGKGSTAITLMKENPAQLLEFFPLAERVNRKVKQNLIFALVYNTISIPVAASGLLNPIIAATAMLLSSLSVTFNTLLMVKKDN